MRYFYLVILISISFFANAQEDSIQIATDRPGFSEYPKTIPSGYFQIEAGFSFESETVNPTDRLQLINWNNTLLKYGLLEGLELRLSQSYQSERLLEGGQSPQFIWQSFSGPVVVGTKIDLLQESGLKPQTAIVAEYGFNTFSPETFERNNFYRIQLTSKYQLNPEWYLMGNLGYDKRFNDFGRLRYTVNSGYSLNQKLSIYAEIYGFLSESRTPLNYFDGGLIYLINPKLQLDVHAGFDMVQQTNSLVEYQQSFIAFGLGYLFKVKK
ncbi:Putative MetA-pathway of phenol degradation [Marivirga sericea]|uniref:Putative MetA-pathway of phenol degradation n=1 Tax=Marivirga sericea TaxID=1028 RepID=A0A1X7K1F4_9BACT|nr:transporter [Marivirga sericea]SMG34699.1 Putative MetA-pathway of phenol degradation [Marivirga sericea]